MIPASIKVFCLPRLLIRESFCSSNRPLAPIAPLSFIFSCKHFHITCVPLATTTSFSIFDSQDAQAPPPKTRVKKSRKYRLQNEKTVYHESPFLRTSVKKLGNLARQIAGQNLNQAITQMEFSNKRVAKEVAIILKAARQTGINEQNLSATEMFIDQAWVGRGSYLKKVWYGSRGRLSIRRKPSTHIKVIIKGNDTLQRRIKEAEEKRLRRKLRVPLPSKPIHMRNEFSC